MIRRANTADISRIAEILVFDKRIKYRSIFQNDKFSFNELQVLSVAKQYSNSDVLRNIFVYDDGIIKGMIHIEENEVVELYVDYFFWNKGIGSSLIQYAIDNYKVVYLWALEKNVDAIKFYERHGFHLSGDKKYETNY